MSCRASGRVPGGPEAVYARVVDPERFPELFRGFGPVPGIRCISGSAQRRVLLEDGSAIEERFQVMEPGRRLVYRASGFAPPLGWWCRQAHGEWLFRDAGGETDVTWDYRFQVDRWLQRRAVALAVAPFFRRAMADCMRRLTVACTRSNHQ